MSGPCMPRTVLVFDDSPLVLDVTRLALERAGFIVATAADLASFERERATATPDLILMDVQMPEAFGDDVATTLRGARAVRVPILLMSNIEDGELEQRALESNADGWIPKRAGVAELVRRVEELLAQWTT
jgi:DNA-binding response OmpR family regulator